MNQQSAEKFVVFQFATNDLTPWRQNLEVHDRIHNSPPPNPVLCQVNPHPTPPPPTNPLKINSVPILPSTPRSSEWSLSFGLSNQNLVYFSLLSCACHMPHPPRSPWFDLANAISGVQIMKLPIVQLSPLSRYSILLGPNILLSTLFSNTLSLYSSDDVRDQVSHPYKTTGWIVVFYILTFTFLDRQEDRRPWAEW
jgi:hypothetical protein